MKLLPFKMRQKTDLEKWRADTFWTKEPETLAWIDSFKPEDVFFDVGANIGIYSLYCAAVHPDVAVLAFEPAIANFRSLDYNITLNGFENITPGMTAIGNVDGFVKFLAAFADDGVSPAGASGGQVSLQGVVIPAVTIDSLAIAPDHVKIDIDGQELDVLLGMIETLPEITSILVEVTPDTKSSIMHWMSRSTWAGLTTLNRFNTMTPHSRERRIREGIPQENIVFTRS